jgi:4-hydroxy-tetrahydrodipicolinate reductase
MKIPVMINGLPGQMATEAARAVVRSEDFSLFPAALTGQGMPESTDVLGIEVKLYSPQQRHQFTPEELRSANGIILDFSTGQALQENVPYYTQNGLDFAVGATKGDRKTLDEIIRRSQSCALFAPNMALQVIALQTFLVDYARNHSGALVDHRLQVTESHQTKKKDTSGTAIAILESYQAMGIDMNLNQIRKLDLNQTPQDYEFALGPNSSLNVIRDTTTQIKMGIPFSQLNGHGWHTYTVSAKEPSEGIDSLSYELDEFMYGNPIFKKYDYSEIGKDEASETAQDIIVTRRSPDGNILFGYRELIDKDGHKLSTTHNVGGRSIYADGALEHLRYLAYSRTQPDKKGKICSGMDVLRWINNRN